MNVPLHETQVPTDTESRPARPELARAALASFVLGLLALPLNIFTGVPALLLGYRGLYAINAGEGRLRGRALAVSGMLLGALGCLIGIAFGFFVVFRLLGEASSRVESANNLRQIGAAIQRYYKNHQKTYPAATIPNPALAPDERLSWLAAVLPYLERRKGIPAAKWETLVASIDPKQGWQAPVHAAARKTNIPTFLCGGQRDPATPGLTDYVGLAGVGADAASVPLDDPRAGFFGYNRTVQEEDVTRGQSYILVVTETTKDNGPWIAGGPATVRGVDVDQAPLIGVGRPFGGCHFSPKSGVPGLYALHLDGSVEYFTNEIPPQKFADLTRLRP